MEEENELTICDYHNEIINLTIQLLTDDDENERNFKQAVMNNVRKEKIKKINTLSQKALEAGRNMEQRLEEYRKTIEGLGFERTNKEGN